MTIIINGQRKELTAGMNIEEMLAVEGMDSKLVAVARNGSFVPKGDYANTNLAEGDEIEIVAPMQGG